MLNNERRLIRRFIEKSEKTFVQNTKYIYQKINIYVYIFKVKCSFIFRHFLCQFYFFFKTHIFIILQYPQRTTQFMN